MIVKNISSKSGVQSVQIPVWNQPDQSDLIWYSAKKQSDGTYKVHVDIANHHNNRSTYNVHVYVMDNNGVQTLVATTSQQVSETKDELTAEDKSGKETTYQLTLKNQKAAKATSVNFAVWSEQNESG